MKLTQVEQSEELIGSDFIRIPKRAAVDDQNATTLLILVCQNVDNIALGESLHFMFGHQAGDVLVIFLPEVGNATKLKEVVLITEGFPITFINKHPLRVAQFINKLPSINYNNTFLLSQFEA